MAKRIAGTAFVKVNGRQLELEGKLEAPLTSTVREMKAGSAGVVGFKESVRIPYIKGGFFVPPGFPLEEVRSATDVVVTADFANGMTYVLSGACVVGEPSLGSDEGTTELEWNGDQGKWI